MTFNWLTKFQQETEKDADYAEKSLAAYRLGMKAKGSIVGVRIVVNKNCCAIAKEMPASQIYHPDKAPIIPLKGCPLAKSCQCVYRPVMKYEQTGETP